MSGWTYLVLGIVTEVAGTFCMKLSHGFSHFIPSVLFIVFFAIALALINLSMKTIDMSVAYAIWSGVGIACLAILGIFFLDEPATLPKLFFMLLIGVGVIGLHAHS